MLLAAEPSPAAHPWQNVDPPALLYVPAAHSTQSELTLAYDPGAHMRQMEPPTGDPYPVAQLRHVERPPEILYFPAPHDRQLVSPTAVLYWPAGHSLQLLAFTSGPCVPTAHSVHADEL